VLLRTEETKLPKESVANVSQIVSVNRSRLDEFVCELDPAVMFMIDNGIRLVFDV
jgi:mRNA interferase MazF